MDLKVETRSGSARRCLYCREGFAQADPAWDCPGCATPYHLECRAELDACAIPGCGGARPSQNIVARPRARARSGVRGSSWRQALCLGTLMFGGFGGGFTAMTEAVLRHSTPTLGVVVQEGLLGSLPGAILAGVLYLVLVRPRSGSLG